MNNEFLFSKVYKEVGRILEDLETMVTIDRATEYNAKGAAFHRKNIVRAFVQARKKVENLEIMCVKHKCIDGADYCTEILQVVGSVENRWVDNFTDFFFYPRIDKCLDQLGEINCKYYVD